MENELGSGHEGRHQVEDCKEAVVPKRKVMDPWTEGGEARTEISGKIKYASELTALWPLPPL